MEYNKNRTYEEIREEAINYFGKVFKDKVAFDAAMVDEKTRIKLLQDPEYVTVTKAMKARLFIDQIDEIDSAMVNAQDADDGKDHSQAILKAIEMKQKLLLDDLNINQDESSAMNIVFVAMTKEDYAAMDTVEINEGSNNGTELSSSFGQEAGTASAEDKMKADVKERMAELKKQEEEDGNN